MADGKISDDPTATTKVNLYLAGVQDGGNVKAPASLFAGGDVVEVATRTALKALDTAEHTVAILTEAGRVGLFALTAGNYTALAAADPEEGCTLVADDTAVSNAAWLRVDSVNLTPLMFGASGDTLEVAVTVSITSGAAVLTATGAAFVAGDVGKRIVVPGAGAAGAPLATTIAAFTDATHVNLAANAGTTLSAVATTIAYGTDDYTALQAYANFCGYTGAPFVLTDRPEAYSISAKIQIKVTRNLDATDSSPASDFHFTDNLPFNVIGLGKAKLLATASMTSMIELIYDTPDSDIAPFYSTIENIDFDGSGLATANVYSNYAMHLNVQNNRFHGAERGIEFLGYGVGRIERNTFRNKYGVYMPDGGGDCDISRNDFYAGANNGAGVYMAHYAGDTRIADNVFTNEEAYTGVAAIDIAAPGASLLTGESRHVVIRGNEFAAYTVAIRMTGTSTSLRNIFQQTITENHLIGIGGSNPGKFLEATDCTELQVFANFMNHADLGDAADWAISLTRCERCIISGNNIGSYQDEAILLVNSNDNIIQGNRFDNCGKSSASLAVIDISGASSVRNLFQGNRFRQTSASYAQIGVKEGTGVDSTTALYNLFDTVATQYSFVGANSIGVFMNGVTMVMQGDNTGFTFAPRTFHATATAGPTVNLQRSRGTAAVPAAVQSGDRLGFVGYAGQYDTTPGNIGNSLAILGLAAENFTSGARGADLSIETTASGGTTRAEAVRIGQDKKLTGKGAIVSDAPTAGVGYTTGAGGAVTQATSKSTGVTLDKVCGEITMNGAALAAGTIVSFVLTDSAIAAKDVMTINHVSGGTLGAYSFAVSCAAGSATIYVRNNSAGSLSEAIVLRYSLGKASIT